MDEFQTQAPYPSAPPTVPGELPQHQPTTKWPIILGVIGIVFGVLASLGAAWTIISSMLFRGWVPFAPPQMAQQLQSAETWSVASGILTLPPAVLLLIAGIGLCSRRRWGVSIGKIWAVLKMVVVLGTLAVGWQIQGAALQSNPALGSPGMPPAGMLQTIQVFSVIVGLLWGWALPVFMLIWFSREKIKAEVASWR